MTRWERALQAVPRRIDLGVGAGLRPALDALRRRDRVAMRQDLVAAVTVAACLIPQVLAYSVVAGLPPVTGLLQRSRPWSSTRSWAVHGGCRPDRSRPQQS
jgi:hypothetical protein